MHYIFSVTRRIPHDSNCFTQGLLFYNGYILESCGLFGKSNIRKVHPDTGEVLLSKSFPKNIFAEGIVVVNDLLLMLTWKNGIIIVMNPNSFQEIARIPLKTHSGEGWGITSTGKEIVISDGSQYLSFFTLEVSPQVKLELTRKLIVTTYGGKEIKFINELEFVDGYIYANVWYEDYLLRIDNDLGMAEKIPLQNLYPKLKRSRSADCLNGIAFNESTGQFLLTGKLWPSYYNVNIRQSPAALEIEINN